MMNSGNSLSKGSGTVSSDVPSLSDCLQLELIDLGNQKYTRSGELKRVLGVPLGSNSDDHSFGGGHPKPSHLVAAAELKHFRESVLDDSRRAKDRAKRLHESLFKLDKYRRALSSKRRHKSDLLKSEGSGGANVAKIGSQINRSPHENTNQRLEDRAKCTGLNKRVRTSMADVREEGRSTNCSRQQMAVEKCVDAIQDVKGGTIQSEEKTRRLAVGGEGWETKNKKKRSIGQIGGRLMNGERDLKQALYPKSSDSKFLSSDTRGFRSKSSPRVGGVNKSDDSVVPATLDTSTMFRDIESGSLSEDRMTLLEQRDVMKGSNKSSLHEDNPPSSPHIVIKAKVSRAPRAGSIMQLDSSLKVQSSSSPQGSEQARTSSKVAVPRLTNSLKYQMSADSSSNAMAQWVGQRRHKNSRSRRAGVVGPLSSNVETLDSSQNLLSSSVGARTSSIGANRSVVSSIEKNKPKFKRELENVASPVAVFESDESGAGENKSKDKGADSGEVDMEGTEELEAFPIPSRKNKLRTIEIGDGVQRQGRSGRGSSVARLVNHVECDKLKDLPAGEPLIVKPASDKNKSKTGRPPSKKLKDRKGVACAVPILNGGPLDFTGESDDDREELFAAANAARNTKNIFCSGSFWKKMEPIFASLISEDVSYLKRQLNFTEELDQNLSQMLDVEYDVLGVILHKEAHYYSGEGPMVNHNQGSAKLGALCERIENGRSDKGASLYQRLLAALIEGDESEEFYIHGEGKNLSSQYASDDSHCGSCNFMDIMESEVESQVNFPMQKNSYFDSHSCEKTVTSNTIRNPSMSSSLQSNDQWPRDDDFSHSEIGHASEISSNGSIQLQNREFNLPCFPSSDHQYQLLSLDDRLLLELQSIGLCPELLPNLADGEELINQDITELTKELHQQTGRKKRKLGKIDKAVQKGRDAERRNIEQVAMDALITKAYRKRLACRGSSNTKSAARKASRQVALAFVERTLARCRKFEKTGSSCFSEAAIKEVLFSTPARHNDTKSVECVGSGTGSNTCNDVSHNHTSVRGSGIDSHSDNFNRIKKREVLIDDVIASASSRVTSTLVSTTPSEVKGRRTDRDRDQNKYGASRSSVDEIKNERKMKPKMKVNSNPESKREVGLTSLGNTRCDASKEANGPGIDFSDLPLNELDTIGLSNDLDENQDLDSWLNIDEDGLPDHDLVGLEIPMDDLSDLNMF